MLKLPRQGTFEADHKDAIRAFYNIYLGSFENEINEVCLRVDKNKSGLAMEETICIEIDIRPQIGESITVKSSHREMQTALELCFARTRRSLIRQRKLSEISA